MGAMRVCAGELWHLLRRCVTAPTLTAGSANPLYPIGGLSDDDPGSPYVGAAAAANTITVDLQQAENAGFESWPDGASAPPEFWTLVSGAVDRTTTKHSGTYAMMVTEGKVQYQDWTVPSGEETTVAVWARGGGDGETARLRVYNPVTGHWLASNGTWGVVEVDAVTEDAITYQAKSITFTVEPVSTTLRDTVPLQIFAVCIESAGQGFFDDLELRPSLDLVAFFCASLIPAQTITVSRSSDGSAYTTEALTLTTSSYGRPFYGRYAAFKAYRYWRVAITAGHAATSIGELVLAQTQALADPRHPSIAPHPASETQGQTRAQGRTGRPWIQGLSRSPRRASSAYPLLASTLAVLEAWLDLSLRRSRYGALPSLLIPWDAEAEILWCTLSESAPITRVETIDRWTAELGAEEWPSPVLSL